MIAGVDREGPRKDWLILDTGGVVSRPEKVAGTNAWMFMILDEVRLVLLLLLLARGKDPAEIFES